MPNKNLSSGVDSFVFDTAAPLPSAVAPRVVTTARPFTEADLLGFVAGGEHTELE